MDTNKDHNPACLLMVFIPPFPSLLSHQITSALCALGFSCHGCAFHLSIVHAPVQGRGGNSGPCCCLLWV
jgi:hypothetical protein